MARFRAWTMFAVLFASVSATPTTVPAKAQEQNLKLLISVESPTVQAPNPLRVTLYFHNAGSKALWLYRPIRNKPQAAPPGALNLAAENGPSPATTSGGAYLVAHLVPMGTEAGARSGVQAAVITSQGLPHPKLVRLAPEKDYEEQVAIRVHVPMAEYNPIPQFVQGHYQFFVTYSANYSNQAELIRDLNIGLWHGELKSNAVSVDFRPPTGQGSIEGTVVDQTGRPFAGVLLTLANSDEESLDQLTIGNDGSYSFTHLGWGRYWVSARRPGAWQDTAVFRHVDLSAGAPRASEKIMVTPINVFEAKRMLHKPVIFRVVDQIGKPLAKVHLVILFSDGNVVDNTKVQTDEDGTVAARLIPGANFVTLRRQGCPPQEETANVAAGGGIDGFQIHSDCSK